MAAPYFLATLYFSYVIS